MPKHEKKRKNKKSEAETTVADVASAATVAPGDVAAETAAGVGADAPTTSRKDDKSSDKKSGKKADKKADKQADKAARKAAKDSAKSQREQAPAFKHVRKKKLTSGKGPTPLEIGESLVALFNAGKSDEAESTWYHRKIESIEDDGSVFEGWKGVLEKGKWWKENFTVLSMKAAGPYVCSTGFAVVYSGRVRMADGTEVDARECGVYTVEKGRIVREQFMKACFGA
jgi:hypothetical protein